MTSHDIKDVWKYSVLIVALLISFAAAGCDSDSRDATSRPPDRIKGANIGSEPQGHLGDRLSVIKAGYGIPSCYVGMSMDELGTGWEPVPEASLADQIQLNKQDGVSVVHEGGKITTVDFSFVSDELKPFNGRTERGITAQSKEEDVQSKYGEPSCTLKSARSDMGEFPNANQTDIDYVELGIQFQFVDQRLVGISVYAPERDFDYEGFGRAMGKSVAFIRKPHSKEQQVHGRRPRAESAEKTSSPR